MPLDCGFLCEGLGSGFQNRPNDVTLFKCLISEPLPTTLVLELEVQLMFILLFVCRMVRPNWALPLSCVQGPTQNAVCMVRVAVLTGNVTWTAALKTATAPTLWIQHGMRGESQSV